MEKKFYSLQDAFDEFEEYYKIELVDSINSNYCKFFSYKTPDDKNPDIILIDIKSILNAPRYLFELFHDKDAINRYLKIMNNVKFDELHLKSVKELENDLDSILPSENTLEKDIAEIKNSLLRIEKLLEDQITSERIKTSCL